MSPFVPVISSSVDMTLWAIYVTAQFNNGEIWHRRYWGYMREVADPYFVGSRVEIEIF